MRWPMTARGVSRLVPACATLLAIAVVPVSTQPVLRVSTELIVLHVSVLDDDRRPVPDLPCDAFIVYEDNVPQDLRFCESGAEPMALGLVIDSSTSMARYRELLAATGEAFVRLGNPSNEVFVLQFNEHVRNALGGRDFTSDPVDVAHAVRATSTRGRTAMHDAVGRAIEWARRSDRLKKAIVLVSDGGDNASRLSFDEALARARRADVAIFSIAMDDGYDRDADVGALRRLARETGGLVFTPRSPAELGEAFERIADDLRSGYTLAYASKEHEHGEYHLVRVVARTPDGRRLVVRSRVGFVG
jgi:Ca-activated chloride channel family protein